MQYIFWRQNDKKFGTIVDTGALAVGSGEESKTTPRDLQYDPLDLYQKKKKKDNVNLREINKIKFFYAKMMDLVKKL